MKKILILVVLIAVAVGASLIFDKRGGKNMIEENSNQKKEIVREPAVAGAFYPGTKEELQEAIDKFMSQIELPSMEKYTRGLIVPHAGYAYSGQVAAYGYKGLQGQDIDTVILIGNSHREQFEGASIYPRGYYKTPLGNIEIDENLASRIINFHEKLSFHESAHALEHSLEVQLPFLQTVLNEFKIIPIIIGNQPGAVDILIAALKGLIDNKTLLIASSDLSHYPEYEHAKYSDNKVVEAILTGDRVNLQKTILDLEQENIPNLQTCACGQQAIETVMGLIKDAEIKLLNYANSGDLEIGDKSQVVGYASIAFTAEELETNELDKQEQQKLISIAKHSVETFIKTGEKPQISNDFSRLEKHLGAFVTLRKNGQLRGCIGRFQPDVPLYEVVRDMAIAAASEDHRFKPVTAEEFDDLKYEVSVLSPLQKIDSWEDIDLGRQGVQIRQGVHSGVFLPQVAKENNWDLDTFMSILCTQKAGLSSDCWKDLQTEIYVFTAQVFGEN